MKKALRDRFRNGEIYVPVRRDSPTSVKGANVTQAPGAPWTRKFLKRNRPELLPLLLPLLNMP